MRGFDPKKIWVVHNRMFGGDFKIPEVILIISLNQEL